VWPAIFIHSNKSKKLKQNRYDICVVGGGFMGAAVSLGLVEAGSRVLMVDKVSSIHKASRANFGLVWSQSKGGGNRPYARLSERAVREFSGFARSLEDESGIDVELRLGAGLVLSLGEEEFAARKAAIQKMHREANAEGESHPSRVVDRKELQELVGDTVLGDEVTGGSFSEIDGDVNPLRLLKAMRKVLLKKGGSFLQGCDVQSIDFNGDGYRLTTSSEAIIAEKVVLAAGLGNIALAEKIGCESHLLPQKGQLLVTEKVAPFLSFPFSGIRQTVHGSVMIGYTQENTGFDVSTAVPQLARLAARAVRIFPGLKHARIVRSWGSLRILTEDGLPIYDQLDDKGYPGIYLLGTHSCITLASLHATILPTWILGGDKPEEMYGFNLERFNDTV
jgi:glycine/D-amino acid oxidase-like deaminating enzyme